MSCCEHIRENVTLITASHLNLHLHLPLPGPATHRRRLADVRQACGQPEEARDPRSTTRPAGHTRAGGAAAAARRCASAVPLALDAGGVVACASRRQHERK